MRLVLRFACWIINLAILCLLLVVLLTFMASRRWGLDFRAPASGSDEPSKYSEAAQGTV